jgi:small GTP-binding protein
MHYSFRISVEGSNVDFLVFDTVGSETYRNLVPTFLRQAVIGVVVCSIADPTSFEQVRDWVRFIRDYKSDIPLILVRNKIDLFKTLDETANALAEELKLNSVFDTSAMTEEGIETLFDKVAELVQ